MIFPQKRGRPRNEDIRWKKAVYSSEPDPYLLWGIILEMFSARYQSEGDASKHEICIGGQPNLVSNGDFRARYPEVWARHEEQCLDYLSTLGERGFVRKPSPGLYQWVSMVSPMDLAQRILDHSRNLTGDWRSAFEDAQLAKSREEIGAEVRHYYESQPASVKKKHQEDWAAYWRRLKDRERKRKTRGSLGHLTPTLNRPTATSAEPSEGRRQFE